MQGFLICYLLSITNHTTAGFKKHCKRSYILIYAETWSVGTPEYY